MHERGGGGRAKARGGFKLCNLLNIMVRLEICNVFRYEGRKVKLKKITLICRCSLRELQKSTFFLHQCFNVVFIFFAQETILTNNPLRPNCRAVCRLKNVYEIFSLLNF